MDNELEKKLIEEHEIEALIQLHNSLLNDDRTPEQWKHNYLGFIPESSIFTILKDKKTIIGSQGMLPFSLMFDKSVLTGKSENSLLDPQYRGGTLFQDLYDFAMDQCEERKMEVIWGFTSAVYVWKNKLQFNVFEGVMHQAINIINLKAAIKASLTSLKQTNRNQLIKKSLKLIMPIVLIGFKIKSSIQQRFYLRHSNENRNIIIKARLESESDIKQLFQRFREQNPNLISIDQSNDFIDWRIYNNPNLNYKTYFAYENGHLKGYCYITVNKKLERGYLTDLTFENKQIGKALLTKALSCFKDEKVSFAIFYGNFENSLVMRTWKLLKWAGFRKKRNPMAVVIRNISFQDPERIDNISNWHMTGLWTEGYSM